MHYTDGDGSVFDATAGGNIFADENPPTRDATQVRHEEANAWQQELINIVKAAGLSLNASTESIAQMVQVRDAINILIANGIAPVQNQLNAIKASEVANDSSVTGTKIKDALNTLVPLESHIYVGNWITTVQVPGSSIWTPSTGSATYNQIRYILMANYLWCQITLNGTLSGAAANRIEIDLSSIIGASKNIWLHAEGSSISPTRNGACPVEHSATDSWISFNSGRESGGLFALGGYTLGFQGIVPWS